MGKKKDCHGCLDEHVYRFGRCAFSVVDSLNTSGWRRCLYRLNFFYSN
jgi:hypothetical protein